MNKQFIIYIILSLMLFTFILLIDRLFQLMTLFLNKGVSFMAIIQLILYSIPTIMVLAMPMGIVTSGILTFGRMAYDGEITAVRTSGISLKPLVVPVMLMTLFITVLMFPFNYYLAPYSQNAFRTKITKIAFQDPALRIEESTLIEIEPYTLLCFEVNQKKKTLKEIIIYKNPTDEEPSMSITARKGSWQTTKDGRLVLKLTNGTIKHQPEDNPQKLSNIKFNKYSITLRTPENAKKISKSIESMTAHELRSEIKRLKSKGLPAHKIATRYYLRGALAGSIPVMMLIGIPLGIRAESKGKTIGIGLSLMVISAYYFLMVTGIKISFNHIVSPIIGVWLPNIIVAIIGLCLFSRSYSK
ncbi:LptF/LptG family permease [Elusimicrobiota bacterium]